MIKQSKYGFDQENSGQAGKQKQMSRYNSKLMKYISQANKFPLWGAFGAHLVVKGLYLISLAVSLLILMVVHPGQCRLSQVPI